ncbi:hypothetical protein VNO78_30578 [Psophocarpus tetragonolobus]|uniref:Uncharacterized protein n=1 Tax=Psophocarpus tetragonolobus TaxID=3891 RepID=A0AAN9RXB8_PSOTE
MCHLRSCVNLSVIHRCLFVVGISGGMLSVVVVGIFATSVTSGSIVMVSCFSISDVVSLSGLPILEVKGKIDLASTPQNCASVCYTAAEPRDSSLIPPPVP